MEKLERLKELQSELDKAYRVCEAEWAEEEKADEYNGDSDPDVDNN